MCVKGRVNQCDAIDADFNHFWIRKMRIDCVAKLRSLISQFFALGGPEAGVGGVEGEVS